MPRSVAANATTPGTFPALVALRSIESISAIVAGPGFVGAPACAKRPPNAPAAIRLAAVLVTSRRLGRWIMPALSLITVSADPLSTRFVSLVGPFGAPAPALPGRVEAVEPRARRMLCWSIRAGRAGRASGGWDEASRRCCSRRGCGRCGRRRNAGLVGGAQAHGRADAAGPGGRGLRSGRDHVVAADAASEAVRSEEHTSELQSHS